MYTVMVLLLLWLFLIPIDTACLSCEHSLARPSQGKIESERVREGERERETRGEGQGGRGVSCE